METSKTAVLLVVDWVGLVLFSSSLCFIAVAEGVSGVHVVTLLCIHTPFENAFHVIVAKLHLRYYYFVSVLSFVFCSVISSCIFYLFFDFPTNKNRHLCHGCSS